MILKQSIFVVSYIDNYFRREKVAQKIPQAKSCSLWYRTKIFRGWLFREHNLFAIKHFGQYIRECSGINDIDNYGNAYVDQAVVEREHARHGLNTVVHRYQVPRQRCLRFATSYHRGQAYHHYNYHQRKYQRGGLFHRFGIGRNDGYKRYQNQHSRKYYS